MEAQEQKAQNMLGSVKQLRPKDKKCKMCGKTLKHRYDDSEYGKERWILNSCNLCYVLKEKGVQKRYLRAKISDIQEQYKKYYEENLFIYGSRGTGKTHLLAAFIKKEIKDLLTSNVESHIFDPYENYPAFIDVPRFLFDIRQTFNKGNYSSNEKDIFEKYSKSQTLYLDDLGAEKSTDWAIQTLYLLIDYRYSNEMKTVIASNLTLDEIADKIDDRISSRIAGMCKIIEMKGGDRRLKQNEL